MQSDKCNQTLSNSKNNDMQMTTPKQIDNKPMLSPQKKTLTNKPFFEPIKQPRDRIMKEIIELENIVLQTNAINDINAQESIHALQLCKDVFTKVFHHLFLDFYGVLYNP